MTTYSDLKIIDDDLVLDAHGEPELVTDLGCIAQDIKHMIRESGLSVQIVGERDPETRQLLIKKIEILMESDLRIVPGTAHINYVGNGNFNISAETDFGDLGQLV